MSQVDKKVINHGISTVYAEKL